MTRLVRRWLRALALPSLVAIASCGSSARLSGVGDPISAGPPASGRGRPPLYVITLDSLLTLAEGTPVEVVLLSGAHVLGTSLRLQPDSSAEFHVRAPARRMFEQPDTVQIPILGIEVAVSTVPLTRGSQRYIGPRKLEPLPRAGEGFTDPIRPVVVTLTILAMFGVFALVGALVVQ
jgi:hypothetical protein